jgi:two-component system sensor histidine kinase/response regulator
MRAWTSILTVCLGLFVQSIPRCADAQSIDIVRLQAYLGSRSGPGTDPGYVDTLNALAHAFYGINADSAFFYSKKALEHATRMHYEKGESESWRMLGNTYELVGDYLSMLDSYHRSLTIAEKIGNTRLVARANVNIAMFYKQAGEYDRARQIMESVSDLCKRSGDSVQIAYVYSDLSDLAFRQGHYDSALAYARQALQVASRVKEAQAVAAFNNDIGRALAAMGSCKAAIEQYRQSLDYYQRANDRLGTATTCILLAQVCATSKDLPRALQYGNQAFKEAFSIKRDKEIGESSKVLADIYAAMGDDRHALQYFRYYKDFSDSLFKDQHRRQIFAMAARYDYEQKEARLRAQQVQKDELHAQSLRTATLGIVIAGLLIFFLCIIAILLMKSRRAERRMNQILVEKNEKIEEQKEAIEQQAVQLLLNNQQKDKLFSIVAHDLRGPLNSLKDLLGFLKEERLSEREICSMLNELRRNVDYSSELVSNLLFWAASQLNGFVVNPVVLPLQPLVTEVLALYSQQAQEKNVLLIQASGPRLCGYADKDMIQVVIRNLISNAIKFCRSGDSLNIGATLLRDEIEVCVVDTGIGIREDVLEKIRRNESVTSYGTAREKGTGLGLMLCKEFTEANKGRFRVESEWGKGCRCYFTIPLPPSSSSISV